jgi:D-inositol-3-phosphate glycosyltransferase
MSVRRVAAFSVHTSPLAQPGHGDGGGMNVYVASLASALAHAGVDCDVFVRRDDPAQPHILTVEPGYRVVHVDAGPPEPLDKTDLVTHLDEFARNARVHLARGEYDVLHAHYWMSGVVAHALKHVAELPLVSTFHTLAAVKAAAGAGDEPPARLACERDVVRCSDLILASTTDERGQLARHYDADVERVEVVAPGVDHRLFHPRGREHDRAALVSGDDERLVLFAGRIQPLKGADLAIEAVAALHDPRVVLLLVGGPSGAEGARELARLRTLVRELGIERQVRFVAPVPHTQLARYYRAVDACIVPSRSESFGLVALEAAACGTPVVAAAVDGLRSLVDDGHTGYLVEGRDPTAFAAPLATLLADRDLAWEMGTSAAARAGRYSWNITAARLRRLYGDLAVREPVQCR